MVYFHSIICGRSSCKISIEADTNNTFLEKNFSESKGYIGQITDGFLWILRKKPSHRGFYLKSFFIFEKKLNKKAKDAIINIERKETDYELIVTVGEAAQLE